MTVKSWTPFLMVEASAGSGKTTKLIARYVELLHLGGDPETILATTFSRKAAQEIFSRLVAGLHRLALSEEPVALPGSSAIFSQDEGYFQLKKILRCPSAIPIGTVDSFAQRFAKLFFLELGITPDWSIPSDFEYEELEEEALHEVLKDFHPEDRTALFHVIVSHESTRSVFSRLFAKVSRLQGVMRDNPEALWEWEVRELLPSELQEEGAFQHFTKEELLSLLQTLELPKTKLGQPNQKYVRAHLASLESLRVQDWSGFLSKGIPKAILDARVREGVSPPSFQGSVIPAELQTAYQQVVNAVIFRISDELVRRTSITARFLRRFQQVLVERQLERALLGFSDVKNILRSLLSTFQYQHVVYRLDRSVQHILLDEFQDTTPAEWDILNIFVSEIANGAPDTRSVSIVGDPKQSIYGWRGGDAELFGRVRARYPHFSRESLNKSYRSSPIIIDFVNTLFSRLHECTALESFSDAVKRWSSSFSQHEAAQSSLPGCVKIFSHSPEDDGAIEERVANEVALLLSQNPNLRVALLVRKNKEILPLLISCLKRGIEVSAEGGSPLTDSPVVVAVLHLLHAAVHPHDTRSVFHIEQTPIGAWLQKNFQASARGLKAILKRVEQEGVAKLLTEVLALFSDCSNERDRVRSERLLTLAFQFDEEGHSSIDSFIRRVRREQMEEERLGVVRIMTIHRSKGLEFDAVFLPNLGYDMTRVLQRDLLVQRASEKKERVLLYANRDVQKALPLLGDMYSSTLMAQVEEELSVLYVAMTRARSALYIALSPSKLPARSSPEGVAPHKARILAESLVRELCLGGAESLVLGDPDWCKRLSLDETSKQIQASRHQLLIAEPFPISSVKRQRFFTTLSPTKSSDNEGFIPADSSAIQRGELIHRFFEQVEWLDDKEAVSAARSKALKWWQGSQMEGERLLDEVLKRVFGSDALLGFFLKARVCQQDVEGVFRELPFSFFRVGEDGGEPVLVKGVIDRFVLYKDGSGDLFDFKTGGTHLSHGEILQRYSGQVRVYMEAIGRLLNLEKVGKGGLKSWLCFFDRGEVIPVRYDS